MISVQGCHCCCKAGSLILSYTDMVNSVTETFQALYGYDRDNEQIFLFGEL